MKKLHTIRTRINEDEYGQILAMARAGGFIKKRSGDVNLSEFLRHQIFQDGSYLNQKELDSLYEQMKKIIPIGTLFNNIAHHMNRSAKIMREEGIKGYPKFKESDLEEMQIQLKEAHQIQRKMAHYFIQLLGQSRSF